MSPVIQSDDLDFSDVEPKKVSIPPTWLRRVRAAGERLGCSPRSLIIQMVRYSLGLPEKAPLPEGKELRGAPQDHFYLAPFRWKAIKAEGAARGHPMSTIFQAHFLRGLEAAEAQAREEGAK